MNSGDKCYTEAILYSFELERLERINRRGEELNYIFSQVTLATSLKVVVRLYFDKGQQKHWLEPQERLPTTPFFTQYILLTPKIDQFWDLSKYAHAIYHLKENLVLHHIIYIRKCQINLYINLKYSELFTFLVKK